MTPEKQTVEGTVKSVVYRNEENGYTVLRVEPPSEYELNFSREIILVGKVRAVWEGEEVKAEGQWVDDKNHGRQFKADSITCVAPRSLKGIEKYLASGLIKGVGKATAHRIVERFGHDTLHVLSHQIARLREVPKLGRARIEQIRRSWHANETMRENMIFGQTYGISVGRMAKIVRRYGPDAIAIIKADPYKLCRDIWGIGFLTADRIALSTGIAKDSPLRARASVSYTLETEADEGGHCWCAESDLLLRANELTGISVEKLALALEDEVAASRITAVTADGVRRLYLNSLYRAEKRVAGSIRKIISTPRSLGSIDSLRAVEWWQKRNSMLLSSSQADALKASLSGKFSIITGGPGVGKTTIIRALVDIFCAKGAETVLAAPTGRAAKRMSESVGRPAQTIHRLLKWNPATNSFTYRQDNQLTGDVFIFDETSMVDIRLAADLFSAIPPSASVVMVGDTDQLPSVGPGNVLGDLIASGCIPSTRLDVIFRQDNSGLIVKNAHHVNAGEMIEVRSGESDFYFIRCRDPEVCLKRTVEMMAQRIPSAFGLNPLDDIQILTPMRRNLLGAENLNSEMQKALNAEGPSVSRAGGVLRVGDRVMQLRNNYDKDVYNGDTGKVLAVTPESGGVVVDFDGRPVAYDSSELDELVLAYATTIHKSQGSEYPAVIVILHTQHYVMLQRNLLYTAITRGRRLVVLIGAPYALDTAIKTNTVRERRTSLAEALA